MITNQPVRCVILGGGGHARVLIDCMRAGEVAVPFAILDSDRSLWGKAVLGVPVQGGDELLPDMRRQRVRHFMVGLGGVGDNAPRQRLFEQAVALGFIPLMIHHPSAVCSRWATVGAGSVLYPMSVVNAGAVLGCNVIVNTGAIVEHDCVIGNHVHLATGATLASTVRVGTGAHVGAGATVRQAVSIGEGAVVGAGAVVIRDVPPSAIVVGVPAHPLRKLTPSLMTDES